MMDQDTMQLSQIERRGSLRIRLQERAQIGKPGKDYHNAISYDISESGISVISNDYIPEKTQVNIILDHKGQPLNLEGEVIWVSGRSGSNQYKIGIKITNPSGELTNIYDYLLRIV